jgi:hypothetical protein
VVSVFIRDVWKILHFLVVGVLHLRRNNVLAAGPFSQINSPATFAAEREVLDRLGHDLLADRTLQFVLWLDGHKSIVDGIHGLRATDHLVATLKVTEPKVENQVRHVGPEMGKDYRKRSSGSDVVQREDQEYGGQGDRIRKALIQVV